MTAKNISRNKTQQSLQIALQHHQAGRLNQAGAIYRQILQGEPNHPDALHLLGVIARKTGNMELASDLVGRAIREKPMEPVYYNSKGLILRDLGKLDEAIACFRKVLALRSDYAEAYYNMANTLLMQGKPDEAVASYTKALALKPNYAEAHSNLGDALGAQGKSNEAIASYHRALLLKPDYARAHHRLGLALEQQARPGEAVSSYRQAIRHQPDLIEAYVNLGKLFLSQGQLDESVDCYRKALLHKPGDANIHNCLGMALWAQHRPDEAIESFQRALSLNPDFAEVHDNLGFMYWEQSWIDKAISCYRRAILLKPDFVNAYNNLGIALQAQGNLDEAIASFGKALQLKPDYAQAYSNQLFLYAYHGSLEPSAYLALARGWELACVPPAEREGAARRRFSRRPLAGRRLKIAYVSGDFRQHAVSYFIEQLFARHDRARVELYACSTTYSRDAVTERIQAMVDHWLPVAGLSDAAFLERIEAVGIDVLIDLSGHTALNRMAVFARRAAPVQVHYLGYFASTGLSEMDYFIGDAELIPPHMDQHFSEQVWRLPRFRASYDGRADAPRTAWRPDPAGIFWVGSFSNLGKLTPRTFSLWARVLYALPQGKLLLKTKELMDAGNCQRILEAMAAHGIPPERIELKSGAITPGWTEHMAYYDRLDIVLDPVGAHGGYTTTCDALWMGAPVITLEGDRMASRMTSSILSAIGHPEWVAASEAEYVDKVVALASDVDRRKALRPAQRELMAGSSICDAQDLALKLEDAYFEMFERRVSII